MPGNTVPTSSDSITVSLSGLRTLCSKTYFLHLDKPKESPVDLAYHYYCTHGMNALGKIMRVQSPSPAGFDVSLGDMRDASMTDHWPVIWQGRTAQGPYGAMVDQNVAPGQAQKIESNFRLNERANTSARISLSALQLLDPTYNIIEKSLAYKALFRIAAEHVASPRHNGRYATNTKITDQREISLNRIDHAILYTTVIPPEDLQALGAHVSTRLADNNVTPSGITPLGMHAIAPQCCLW